MSDPKRIPNGMKFVIGGLAGMGATCLVQPLDLVKTRMQISGMGKGTKEYRNSFHCIKEVFTKEGPLKFYTGLGAGLLRQATYTTTRMGVYAYLIDKYKSTYASNPTVMASIMMAVTAGAVGAFVGNPAEVALIRMVSDGKLPPEERRNYKNVADALIRISREEGLAGLWRGSMPTVGRAMIVNVSQLASYSQIKRYFRQRLDMPEGLKLHFCAAMLSGLLTAVNSMPLDIAKTRLQSMQTAGGARAYTSTIDVLIKVPKHEGFLALWKGFTPYYCRIGPHTVFTFIFLEQLNKLYFKYVLGIDGKSSGL